MNFLKAAVILTGLSIIFFQSRNKINSTGETTLHTDDLERAMQQEFRMTRDPLLNYVPRERIAAAKDYMQSLLNSSRVQALAWTERGPNNIGGRTRAILVDKRDATGNTVFAASVSGGLFKTTNFTSSPPTWTVVNDFLPNLAINSMVQDNTNQNIMYAGTGEGWFNIDAVRGRGIYKSTDGGVTWAVLPSTIQTAPADSIYEYVQDMVIDNNGAVYASLRNTIGLSRGVKRSVDGGATWTQVLGLPFPGFTTGRAGDLEVAGNGDVYACLGIFSRGSIWKSSFATHGANTGAIGTWTEVTPNWIAPRFRIELAVAPSDPQKLYAMGQDSATDRVFGVWRSTNGGTSWDSVGIPDAIINGGAPQTWFNLIMAVDPGNPDVLTAGGLHIGKSTNAGQTWTNISAGSVHVDHHVLHYLNSSRLINGNDGGVYYSTNADVSIPTFSNKNNGYNITQFYACDLHPTNTNYFLAGAQDNNTQKFTAAGINSTSPVVGGDGGFCHIRQTDGQLQIAATTGNNYFRSTNGGGSFASLGAINNSRGQFINPTDLDDNTTNMYCGDDAGRYYVVTNLAGTPASTIAVVSSMGSRELTAVKVDPFTPNTIWVGASFNASPLVLKITNANNAAPTVLSATPIAVPSGSAISSIDVDPTNANHILATLSNFGIISVWESINGGASFNNIEGNLPDMPVRWGMFAPANVELNGAGNGTGGIILATELGIWTTSNINGTSTQWIPNNGGLANVRIDMLKHRASDNTAVAATHGRGLYTTILPTVVTGLPPNPNTKNFIRSSFIQDDQLQIVIGNLQTQNMTIQLFDMKGRLVHRVSARYQNTPVNIGRLQSGTYVLKITGNNGERFVKHVIL